MRTGPRLGWEVWCRWTVAVEASKTRVVWSSCKQNGEVAAVYFFNGKTSFRSPLGHSSPSTNGGQMLEKMCCSLDLVCALNFVLSLTQT